MSLYDHSALKSKSFLKLDEKVQHLLRDGDLNTMEVQISEEFLDELRHGIHVPDAHPLVALSFDFIRKADGSDTGGTKIVKRWFRDDERNIVYTGYGLSNKNLGTADEPNWVRRMTTEQEAFPVQAFKDLEDLRHAGIFLVKVS